MGQLRIGSALRRHAHGGSTQLLGRQRLGRGNCLCARGTVKKCCLLQFHNSGRRIRGHPARRRTGRLAGGTPQRLLPHGQASQKEDDCGKNAK